MRNTGSSSGKKSNMDFFIEKKEKQGINEKNQKWRKKMHVLNRWIWKRVMFYEFVSNIIQSENQCKEKENINYR